MKTKKTDGCQIRVHHGVGHWKRSIGKVPKALVIGPARRGASIATVLLSTSTIIPIYHHLLREGYRLPSPALFLPQVCQHQRQTCRACLSQKLWLPQWIPWMRSPAAVHLPHLPRQPSRLAGDHDTCASCRCVGARLVPEKFHLPVRSGGRTPVLAPVPQPHAGRSLPPHRAAARPRLARQHLANPLKAIWAKCVHTGICWFITGTRPVGGFGTLVYHIFLNSPHDSLG